MNDLGTILDRLHEQHVDFIVIGGVAANAHGSARVTYDLDLLYGRSDRNIRRLVQAMASLQPYLRGAPPGLPFSFDERTIKAGLNFTLETTAGPVDFFGEVAGIGTYEHAATRTVDMELTNHLSHVIDLDGLILAKRAAGRPKDLEVLAELEILRELTDN